MRSKIVYVWAGYYDETEWNNFLFIQDYDSFKMWSFLEKYHCYFGIDTQPEIIFDKIEKHMFLKVEEKKKTFDKWNPDKTSDTSQYIGWNSKRAPNCITWHQNYAMPNE